MAADKWLEEELAELDQAELLIQQAMSDFVSNDITEGQQENATNQVTTTTIPNQVIGSVHSEKKQDFSGTFDLPPPPDLDDPVINKSPTDIPLPPPPLIDSKPPVENKKPPPVMSKPTPPPILPKPSLSTALTARKANIEKKQDESKSASIPPLDTGSATKLPLPASSIPKDIPKNSMEELDFLTSNLLSNMENPKDEDFYGYCEVCGGVVEGEKVGCYALGKVYHLKCFVCVTCGIELHGIPFYAVDKTTYCEKCYVDSLDICAVCQQPITGRILRANGKAFHPACFKCSECGKNLDGLPFITDDSNNIYAVECYHKKFAPRCSVCDLLILPEPGKEETVRVVALDRNFHLTCYKCEKCESQLSKDKGCYPIDDHIYCLKCNNEVQQERAAA